MSIAILVLDGWVVNYFIYQWATKDSANEDIGNPVELLFLIPWLGVVLWILSFVFDKIDEWRK